MLPPLRDILPTLASVPPTPTSRPEVTLASMSEEAPDAEALSDTSEDPFVPMPDRPRRSLPSNKPVAEMIEKATGDPAQGN
jgi:hypothetical protein